MPPITQGKILPSVRFKLAWQTYSVGEVIQPNGTLRDWLLAHGYVELVSTEAPAGAERPGRLTRAAAKKVAEVAQAGKSLFGLDGADTQPATPGAEQG
jgi:hypothetical protein